MPKVSEVCRHVRSKNAGPFWITMDIAFSNAASFNRYADSRALQPEAIGALYGVEPSQVKCFPVRDLSVLKISYPRHRPQGGSLERDMHGGQQYIRLLDIELE